MSKIIYKILFVASLIPFVSCSQNSKNLKNGNLTKFEVQKSETEWKKELTPEAYYVLREKGTEYAWSGKFNDFKKNGTFICAGCSNELFASTEKYDSRSGWPSFWDVFDSTSVSLHTDNSLGDTRTEVVCKRCGGHLGHVFNDGPQPTGKRYCINSVALDFSPLK